MNPTKIDQRANNFLRNIKEAEGRYAICSLKENKKVKDRLRELSPQSLFIEEGGMLYVQVGSNTEVIAVDEVLSSTEMEIHIRDYHD